MGVQEVRGYRGWGTGDGGTGGEGVQGVGGTGGGGYQGMGGTVGGGGGGGTGGGLGQHPKSFKIINFKGAGGPMFKTCQCAPYIAVMTISEFEPHSRFHS